jgi:hypothetical protein
MAWSTPRTWVAGELADEILLNLHIRDQLNFLSTHSHTGAAGNGNDELSGVDRITMDSIGNPGTTRRLQASGANLLWGAADFNVTNEDPVAGTAGLRSLGTGAQQAIAGNHTH